MTRPSPYAEARYRMTRTIILSALERNEWNIMQAARFLGINRTYIYRLMRRYKLTRPEEPQT